MAKNKPYDQFGPYILFKKLESDSLSELWRAAKIEGTSVGPTVALRRFTGGNRELMVANALTARPTVSLLTGTSFVRSQVVDVIDGTPFIAYEHGGGRSLRHIVDRAKGGTSGTRNPIPLDQAIVIAERVALSLATTADLRASGVRLNHGALIPQFIWISEDGDIRVAGQQLGRGLMGALKDPKIASDLARYFSPEYQNTGDPSRASDVYSLGAILYLVVTGQEPPDSTAATAFTQAVRSAKTFSGEPLPNEVRMVLDKSLTLDPAARFATVGEMKQAISALSARYSATTFNLAFYLSNLLKKEIEAEATERERESKIAIEPYVEALNASIAAAERKALVNPGVATSTMFSAIPSEKKRSALPAMIAAVLVLALAGAGAWFALGTKKPAPRPAAVSKLAAVAPPPKPMPVTPEPIVASPAQTTTTPVTSTATLASSDEAAQKRAFEEAVKQKLREEMMKLQADYTQKLQKQQARNAPVLSTAPPVTASAAPAADDRSMTAAQLDQLRRDQRQPEQPATQTAAAAAAVTQPQANTQPPPAPVAQAPIIRQGDVVDIYAVDQPPKLVRRTLPIYPLMAERQRIEATVLITALVSENGDVIEVKVLRGDERFGFNNSAITAVRGMKFTPATKDGKRVKTWLPLPIQFKLESKK